MSEYQKVKSAINNIHRMSYRVALLDTLFAMATELESMKKAGLNVVELTRLVQVAYDYSLYLDDVPNEIPNA